MVDRLKDIVDSRAERLGVPNPNYAPADDQREVWRNDGPGTCTVNQIDPRGNLKSVSLTPGKTVGLTTEERRYNQGMVVNEGQDLFTNGWLRPIKLIEGSSDYEQLMANPNVLSDDDLLDLFDLNASDFTEKISGLTNVGTLEHLRELAEVADARASQTKAISNRIDLVRMTDVAVTNRVTVAGPRPVQDGMSNIQRSSI